MSGRTLTGHVSGGTQCSEGPPADDECCMSGCAVCVYDLYEESLASYEDSITTLREFGPLRYHKPMKSLYTLLPQICILHRI
ncbi:hypothetical protein K443DRAFT_685677 [Laccaria amethystina LaAM-08-1]|uniref:Oxidoreductase-like domain-containing protein n=1 Tax=Laccaria amethystina LaAM-08-1 TaxID=1095629 RepID=A0A0C9X5W3_9AGAR|nr:hypothetical protein K443DRAFT_685677 [Laccaria amethystina LaAM-08-1]